MELRDSRRLTGPNLLWCRPSAVVDVALPDANPEKVVEVWRRQARRILDAVGWRDEQLCSRTFSGGASLALSASVDALYAATEVNEWAWAATEAVLSGGAEPGLEEAAARLVGLIAAERNPKLLELRDAAFARGVAFLPDDETVSVGLGKGSTAWPVERLPDAVAVDWEKVHDVPLVLVTGTNGKTTTVRLVGSMIAQGGRVPGITSTDGIHVAGSPVAEGDYSGPEGARRVLRDRRVEVAALETARGGILRRGLAVRHADAAIVTNVAEDHLGEFGIHDLSALAECKLVVGNAVRPAGRLVLNADDPTLAARAGRSKVFVTWFSLDPQNRVVLKHTAAGGDACVVEDGALVLVRGERREAVLPVGEVPIAFGGAARHNVSNALGAVALGASLGLPKEVLAAALRGFQGTPGDNPGRGNRFEIGGVHILVEFAHNPHSFKALLDTAAALPASRRLILLGHAGDRTDEAIRELARVAWSGHPDRVVIKEMPEYLRGRSTGEIPGLMEEELLRLGATPEAIQRAASELEAVRRALRWARRGDLLLFTIHANRGEVLGLLERLRGLGWMPGQEPGG